MYQATICTDDYTYNWLNELANNLENAANDFDQNSATLFMNGDYVAEFLDWAENQPGGRAWDGNVDYCESAKIVRYKMTQAAQKLNEAAQLIREFQTNTLNSDQDSNYMAEDPHAEEVYMDYLNNLLDGSVAYDSEGW